jgi:hypothetical protein
MARTLCGCWSLRFLLLSHLSLQSLLAISTCVTPITVSNQHTPLSFFVEEEKDLVFAAQEFCLKNLISQADCERIVAFHQQKCFPRSTSSMISHAPPSPLTPSSEDSDQGEDKEKVQVLLSSRIRSETQTEIDYSQRVGPVLPVTHQEVTRHLQAFLGETSAETIQRFCGMLKLLPEGCQQVREAYLKLTRLEEEHADELFTSEGEKGEGIGASARSDVDHHSETDAPSSHSSPPLSPSLNNSPSQDKHTLMNQLEGFVRSHWNYLLLVVVVVHVILENPLQM